MKKLWILFFALIFVSTTAYALPDRTGKVDLGLNVSAAIPDASGVDNAVYVGGTLSYGINNWLAVGIESGGMQFEESVVGITFDETAVPILGDVIFRVPMESGQLQPYGVIGLGAIIWDVEENSAAIDADIDTAFAAKFGAGVDWFINDNWIINGEFSYVTSSADSTIRDTATGASITGESDTDYWMVGGGVKYLFS